MPLLQSQVMNVEVETCKRESEKNSSELAKKHVKQLKDLGEKTHNWVIYFEKTSYSSGVLFHFQSFIERSFNQKLILEHEKFQDLQEKLKKTEEDHKKQLRSAEQSKVQALEEATHMYEAKLQEKTQLLAQVRQKSGRLHPTEKKTFMFFFVLSFSLSRRLS